MKAAGVLALVPLVVACSIGHVGPVEPLAPLGETVNVKLGARRSLEGELLAVTESALLVKTAQGLVRVQQDAVLQVTVTRYRLARRPPDLARELRVYSRYPQGLTEAQWEQLLRDAGQSDFTGPEHENPR